MNIKQKYDSSRLPSCSEADLTCGLASNTPGGEGRGWMDGLMLWLWGI